MDLIVILVVLGIVIFFYKKFYYVINAIAIIDILLRLLTFVNNEFLTKEIHKWMDINIPKNIPTMLSNYSSGLFYTILLYLYIAAFIVFEFYLIKGFFKRK